MNFQPMKLTCLAAAFSVAIASVGQQKPTASPTTSATAANSLSADDEHRLQVERFADFGGLLANEEGIAQRHVEEGKPNPKDDIHYSKFVHITEGEEQVMRIILVEAATREFERNKEWNRTGPGAHWVEMTFAERKAAIEAKSRERSKTYEDAIARLKLQFSKEDFKALDNYLFQTDTRLVLLGRQQAAAAAAKSSGGAQPAGPPPTVPK